MVRDTALPARRFTVLLLSLLLYIVVYPVLPDAPVRNTLLLAFHTNIIFAGVWVLGQHSKLARIAIPLAVITLATVWLGLLAPGIVSTGRTLSVVFFVLTTIQLVRYLVQAKSANMATVLASVCGYLMIALVFAVMFVIVEAFVPTAFSIGTVASDAGSRVYFSLITLTTLGYGDIAPVHPLARSLAATEAVVGQFYVAVVVARLVSLVILERDRGGS